MSGTGAARELVEDDLRADRDHGAGTEDAGDSRALEEAVVLWWDDSAGVDENVLAANLLQFGNDGGNECLVSAGKSGDAEDVDVVIDGHRCGVSGCQEE